MYDSNNWKRAKGQSLVVGDRVKFNMEDASELEGQIAEIGSNRASITTSFGTFSIQLKYITDVYREPVVAAQPSRKQSLRDRKY